MIVVSLDSAVTVRVCELFWQREMGDLLHAYHGSIAQSGPIVTSVIDRFWSNIAPTFLETENLTMWLSAGFRTHPVCWLIFVVALYTSLHYIVFGSFADESDGHG